MVSLTESLCLLTLRIMHLDVRIAPSQFVVVSMINIPTRHHGKFLELQCGMRFFGMSPDELQPNICFKIIQFGVDLSETMEKKHIELFRISMRSSTKLRNKVGSAKKKSTTMNIGCLSVERNTQAK